MKKITKINKCNELADKYWVKEFYTLGRLFIDDVGLIYRINGKLVFSDDTKPENFISIDYLTMDQVNILYTALKYEFKKWKITRGNNE